jgi:hypothetical protein
MRIGIDNISPGASTAKDGPGGMRMYLQTMLTGFAALRPDYEFLLFTPAWAGSLLDTVPANVRVVPLQRVPLSRPLRTVYQQTALSAILSTYRLDAFFATATISPVLTLIPTVLAVQFLQFYKSSEPYGKWRTAYLRCLLPVAVRKARRIIIFSETSKADLIRWTHAREDKVRVVPHGIS